MSFKNVVRLQDQKVSIWMDTREINNDGIDEHSAKEGENAVRRIFHSFLW